MIIIMSVNVNFLAKINVLLSLCFGGVGKKKTLHTSFKPPLLKGGE